MVSEVYGMTKTRVRKARIAHVCDDGWGPAERHYINPGDTYAEHVCSPNDPDIGNERWWRVKECVACHERRTGKKL